MAQSHIIDLGDALVRSMAPRRKVLFLDLDGVCNTDAHLDSNRLLGIAAGDPRDIDPAKISLLNQILVRTGAYVVLSTNWIGGQIPGIDERYTIASLTDVLRAKGLVGEVVCATVRKMSLYQRSGEIRLTMRDMGLRDADVCILEDEHEMGALEARTVRCDPAVGLTVEGVERAVALLGGR